MIEVRFRPLAGWPGEPTYPRKDSPFRAPWSETLDLLDRELRALDAEQIVIEIALAESQIRLDGWPRSDSRPEHPGVILSFASKHGPLRYACDRFSGAYWRKGSGREGWQANLRAIALGLEALRKVDRYGITKSGEQYRGWRALPAGSGAPTSREAALEILRSAAGYGEEAWPPDPSMEAIREAAKRGRHRLHPDNPNTGDAEAFLDLQGALAFLGAA